MFEQQIRHFEQASFCKLKVGWTLNREKHKMQKKQTYTKIERDTPTPQQKEVIIDYYEEAVNGTTFGVSGKTLGEILVIKQFLTSRRLC